MKYRKLGETSLVVMAIADIEREMLQRLIQTDAYDRFIALMATQNPDALWDRRRVVG